MLKILALETLYAQVANFFNALTDLTLQFL